MMINYNKKKQSLIFRMCSKTVERMLFGTFILLFMVLSPFSGHAQFIRLKLDIPAKTGQSEIVPFELNIKPEIKNNGLQLVDGKSVLCISGAENFQVLATLSPSDSLRNDMGQAIPFSAFLAYRNDGISNPPGKNAQRQASFPLSNSGKIIENMKNSPQVLQAFIFISATALLPKITISPYVGLINFNLEFN